MTIITVTGTVTMKTSILLLRLNWSQVMAPVTLQIQTMATMVVPSVQGQGDRKPMLPVTDMWTRRIYPILFGQYSWVVWIRPSWPIYPTDKWLIQCGQRPWRSPLSTISDLLEHIRVNYPHLLANTPPENVLKQLIDASTISKFNHNFPTANYNPNGHPLVQVIHVPVTTGQLPSSHDG